MWIGKVDELETSASSNHLNGGALSELSTSLSGLSSKPLATNRGDALGTIVARHNS
jgi:hypothetical protein